MSTIYLDLPLPLSVNRARRIDWAAKKKRDDWIALADALVVSSGQHRQRPIIGAFEARITIATGSRMDLDNGLKALLDYAVRLELVKDDSPKYLKRITVEFGDAPKGAKALLVPWNDMWDMPYVTGYRRQALVKYLFDRKNGAMVQEILRDLYDGTPPNRRVVPVMRREINRQIDSRGWRITATGGPSSIYRLERTNQDIPDVVVAR